MGSGCVGWVGCVGCVGLAGSRFVGCVGAGVRGRVGVWDGLGCGIGRGVRDV